MQHALWVSRLETGTSLPTIVAELERHPHSDQAFIPLRGQPYLVVACQSEGNGSPDLASARAFIARANQGVIYRCNTWHSSLTVLAQPAEFVVVMGRTGNDADDDVFCALDEPLTIVAAGSGGASASSLSAHA